MAAWERTYRFGTWAREGRQNLPDRQHTIIASPPGHVGGGPRERQTRKSDRAQVLNAQGRGRNNNYCQGFIYFFFIFSERIDFVLNSLNFIVTIC